MYRRCGLYFEEIQTGERKLDLENGDYEVDGAGRIIAGPRALYCTNDRCRICSCIFCGERGAAEG